jgi:lysozyme
VTRMPDPNLPWPIPMAAVALIAEREGCRLKAYRTYPKEPWTCGWGETEGVGPDTVWTQAEADRRFLDSLSKFSGAVNAACTDPPTQNELGAMTSLAYNIGLGWTGAIKPRGAKDGFRQSTVLRAHNRGDKQAASRAFGLWNKADVLGNGTLVEVNGLTARRAAEQALYLAPEPHVPAQAMPQVVQAESSVAASPITAGGATTAGAGILAAIAEAKEFLGPAGAAFTQARDFLATAVGVPPSWVLPGVLIGAGIVVVRWRLAQRREGWA